MPIITMLVILRPSAEQSRLPASPVGEVAEPVAGKQQLGEDFLSRQVAHQPLRAGVAEIASQRAAHLAGDAERAPALLGNVDGLDLDRASGAARREAQQPFAGAVVGDLLLDDLRPGDGEIRLEQGRAGLSRRCSCHRNRRCRGHRASARSG